MKENPEVIKSRIREDLVHGYHPRRDDLLAFWESTTGERITAGQRCQPCDGSGEAVWHSYEPGRDPVQIGTVDCEHCRGTGWAELPTAWQRLESGGEA